MKTVIISVLGSKRSGKTTTIEALTRELTKRGYAIAVVKHISETNFTIDTEGKDTWRYAQSGAKTVISVGSNETATIEKKPIEDFSVKEILAKCKGKDIVFVEGLRKLLGKNTNVPKIVVVKSVEEAADAAKTFSPILAFTGPYSTSDLNMKIPYVDVVKNAKGLADIVEKFVKKS